MEKEDQRGEGWAEEMKEKIGEAENMKKSFCCFQIWATFCYVIFPSGKY